ncbi:MAG: hypothetical protein ACK5CE_15385 [Actinomycetes bacterium]
MSTDVREQIRQLAAAFDSAIDDVRIDEIIGLRGAGAPEVSAVAPELAESTFRRSMRWNRGLAAVAAVVLVVSLVAALTFASRGRSELGDADAPEGTSSPTATWFSEMPADPLGSFVWPAPPRAFASVNVLSKAFANEVLGWPGITTDGGPTDEESPQGFDLVDPVTGARVQVVAVPSPDGWGFVQVGSGLEASLVGGAVVLRFAKPRAVMTSSFSVRLVSGEVRETSTDQDQVEVQGIGLEDLVSVLVIGRDGQDQVVSVLGGQFANSPDNTASSPGSVPGTTAAGGTATAVDPLVFADTESWLPRWPAISVSAPPASTSGYGMQRCDSGYGTKILSVDSPTDTSHAYSGTLCVFIELARPRPDAVISCSTSTPPPNYARCVRRTDQTDSSGGGSASSETASEAQQRAMQRFPSGTAWAQAEVFDGAVSASSAFSDDAVSVQLRHIPTANGSADPPGVCFVIELESATATGCVGLTLIATGVAYGAFRDGDGPIELVGIVPDEVTEIEIDGTIVVPVGNVWHHTIDSGSPSPKIVARSADGREGSTA